MFQVFLHEKLCTIGMVGFFAISIIGLLILTVRYKLLIKEAENMSVTKRKELKAIKTKFLNSYGRTKNTEEDRYHIQEQVNVEVFVDKSINKLKFGGFKPYFWRFLCGQSVIISIIFAGAGIFRSILENRMIRDMLPFYLAAFLELYIFFSVNSICNFEGQEKLLRLTIVEYLENHLVNRMQIATVFQAEEKLLQQIEEEQSNEKIFSKEREQELEELLQEFLV